MNVVDRFGALSGAAAVVLGIVGNDVLGTAPGPQTAHPTGQRDLANLEWLAGNTPAQVGVSLELASFGLLILFIAYVCTRVRAAGWLAAAALAGGVIEVAVKLGSGGPMLAAYLLRGEISPETARVLIDMNGAAFVLTWLPMGLFVACAAGAAMTTGQVGRVLGWGGLVVGTAAAMSTVVTGVHIMSAFFVPFVLCLLWILLVSLKWGIGRTVSLAAPVRSPESAVSV